MMLFRNAKKSDLNDIYELAQSSGFGITTLPANKELLIKRLEWSLNSFKQNIQKPFNEYYFFVLEDTMNSKVIGTSAIEACLGHDTPFYSYKLLKRTRVCYSLNIRTDYNVLSLVNDQQGCSELCTLFLDPNYRKNNNGLLLSKGRFLFIARFPERFAAVLVAEMRGLSDEQGHAPFWEAVGKHFFNMSFKEADRLTISTNKQFISDLMPHSPIYLELLPPEAQDVIGKPHPSTQPAMSILLREGFRYNRYVDIFDAGPTLEAPRNQIRTISAARTMCVKNISDDVSSKQFFVSNTQLEFRATICQVIFNDQQNTCIVSKDTAELLKIKKDDHVQIAPLYDASDSNSRGQL